MRSDLRKKISEIIKILRLFFDNNQDFDRCECISPHMCIEWETTDKENYYAGKGLKKINNLSRDQY